MLNTICTAGVQGDGLCQEPAEAGEEDEEDEDDSEHEVLLTTVTEVLPVMAQCLGPERYLPLFQKHFESLRRHLKPSQPDVNRGTAVGGFAEVARHLGVAAAPFCEHMLPLAVRELKCDDSVNRRNAAFCLGALFESCPQQMLPNAPRVLQALHPIFAEEKEADVRDNAAGAVCRLVHGCGGALPLEQVCLCGRIVTEKSRLSNGLSQPGPTGIFLLRSRL